MPELINQSVSLQNFHFFKKHISFEELESTNKWLKENNKSVVTPSGTVVSTLHQTLGRGQIGTSWQDEPGKNLLFSFILRELFLSPHQQFLLNVSICLALQEFCQSQLSSKVSVKWPNDIYAEDQKIAGVLIENSVTSNWESSVIGIGLNVNQTHFPDGIRASSLRIQGQQEFNLHELLEQLLKTLDRYLIKLHSSNYSELLNAYKLNLFGLQEWRDYRRGSEIFKGCIRGIEPNGQLLLEKEDGTILKPGIKEIEYLWN